MGTSCHEGQGIGTPPLGGGEGKSACRWQPGRSSASWFRVSQKAAARPRRESPRVLRVLEEPEPRWGQGLHLPGVLVFLSGTRSIVSLIGLQKRVEINAIFLI